MTFVVALSGGIGSGKSTVADLFEKFGAEIIDTDAISRDLTRPGTEEYATILETFGDDVMDADGRLVREKLREKVFTDDSARRRLEAILHPPIRAEATRRLAESSAPYVILVVPLLIEKGGYDFADRTLIVDCSPERQIERVMQRSKLSRRQVESIMASQAPREVRRARADDVLANEDGLENLERDVETLHQRYLELSRSTC